MKKEEKERKGVRKGSTKSEICGMSIAEQNQSVSGFSSMLVRYVRQEIKTK